MKKKKNIFREIKNTFHEVKTMQWQKPKEWLRTTVFVLAFSIVIILILLALDILFYQLRDKYIL